MSILSDRLKDRRARNFIEKLLDKPKDGNSSLLTIDLIANIIKKSQDYTIVFTRELSKKRALQIVDFCKQAKNCPATEIAAYPQGIDKTYGVILGLHFDRSKK